MYQYGNIAYIGGGFGVGIHNTLEAATFGMPIVFGPNYKRFKEAVDLIYRKGASSITNYCELKDNFDRLIEDENYLKKTSEISKKYVEENIGSTKFIIKKVFNI
jgi:3-deoxy-D-manno-octulosonic-acid transferase